MAVLKWINEAWLAQLRTKLDHTAKTVAGRSPDYAASDDDGEPHYRETGETEPNPIYTELQRKIEAAEYHFATKQRIVEKAKAKGFRPNNYPGRCCKTGGEVKAGAGFTRKDGGRWTTYSREAVIEELRITINDLPDLEN